LKNWSYLAIPTLLLLVTLLMIAILRQPFPSQIEIEVGETKPIVGTYYGSCAFGTGNWTNGTIYTYCLNSGKCAEYYLICLADRAILVKIWEGKLHGGG